MRSPSEDPYGGTCLVGDGGGRRLGWRVSNSVKNREREQNKEEQNKERTR